MKAIPPSTQRTVHSMNSPMPTNSRHCSVAARGVSLKALDRAMAGLDDARAALSLKVERSCFLFEAPENRSEGCGVGPVTMLIQQVIKKQPAPPRALQRG